VIGDVAQAQKDIETVFADSDSDSVSSGLSAGTVEMDMADSKTDLTKPSAPQTVSWEDFKNHYSQWKHFKVLFGCAVSWFMLDVAFYGVNLNQSTILTDIGYTSPASEPYNYLYSLAVGNCLINLMGSVPGYYFTVAFVEKLGRKTIQIAGFALVCIIYVILSAGYHAITSKSIGLFIFLFCLAQFLFNFGPNSTTFIIPGEVFPTRYRSTSHGICAATGKLGAIISSYGFTYIVNNSSNGVQILLGIFSVFMFLGFLTSFLVPETKGISLEELNDE